MNSLDTPPSQVTDTDKNKFEASPSTKEGIDEDENKSDTPD